MAVSVSAVVTAPPPGVRSPKPVPGETMANVVIRNFPGEWSNFLERVRAEFPLDRATLNAMHAASCPPRSPPGWPSGSSPS